MREYSVYSDKPTARPFGDVTPSDIDPILAQMLYNFSQGKYLDGFWRTLSKAIATMQASPSEYGESMLSILGRPLALTTFGISLELADPSLENR